MLKYFSLKKLKSLRLVCRVWESTIVQICKNLEVSVLDHYYKYLSFKIINRILCFSNNINEFPSHINQIEFFEPVDKNIIIPFHVNEMTRINHFNNIHTNITFISFGGNFDQRVDFSEYKSLKYLDLGNNFNQCFILPPNLETLNLGYKFNQKLKNIPNTLNSITFGYNYNQNIDHI